MSSLPLRSVKSLNMSSDEDSYCLNFQAELSNAIDWTQCAVDTEVQVTLDDDGSIVQFHFIVDERVRDRSFGQTTYNVSGRSITAILGEGKALSLTKTWEETQTAKSIVEELCVEVGLTLNWEILNWSIPAKTLVADGEFPIQVIQKIAEAAGAILQTEFDGRTLSVLYKYPVSPTNYENAVSELNITDVDDMFSVNETKEIKPGYNSVLVMDEDYTSSDALSIEEHSSGVGWSVIKIYATPWQEEEINLIHAGDDSKVAITYEGIVDETIEQENVQVIDGKCSVSRGIHNLITYSYNYTDLGTLTISDDTNILTEIIGHSLMTIEYETKYHQFRLEHTEPIKTLFISESE